MQQIYHSNAKTNVHFRNEIKNSSLTNSQLATMYGISEQTVSKWKNRDILQDLSSVPHTVYYSLGELERHLCVHLRRKTWLPVDDLYQTLQTCGVKTSRSSVHRLLAREGLARVPKEEREKAHKFKEYEPGYLHIDVTYMPKFRGVRHYLFVAIDRCTRLMFYCLYKDKTAESCEDFLGKCISFFPFTINHILTDNGLEFTNRLLVSKKGDKCLKPSKMDEFCLQNGIEHRLTKPHTPKTNGMVERVNGTIKSGTIKKEKYNSFDEMETALYSFLVFYNIYRRHGSLKRELSVKTPLDAVEKWYKLKPEIFATDLEKWKKILLTLKPENFNFHQQPCGT